MKRLNALLVLLVLILSMPASAQAFSTDEKSVLDQVFGDETKEDLIKIREYLDEKIASMDDVEPTATSPAAADFDDAGLSEIGERRFYLSTPGGTTENGNVPVIYYEPNIIIKPLGYCARSFDGSLQTFLYVDGHLIEKKQLSDNDSSLNLGPEFYEVGIHTVEAVQYSDNDLSGEILHYTRAQYTVQ